jgi:hypothetical protein
MKAALDKGQFGPWALVTGASSGIGKEFARQIAASGINVVLVARRDALLAELGRAISQEFDVQYRALAMDVSQEGFIAGLADATRDIDIGHPPFWCETRQAEAGRNRPRGGNGCGKWRAPHGERRSREGVCTQPRRGASL